MVRILTVVTAALFSLALTAGHAQERSPYPTKPIRLFVSAAPGAPPDLVARLLGEKLAKNLAQPMIVENRPGASGTIGMNAVAKAFPDGYTLGMFTMVYLTAPSLVAKMPYDTERDLRAVTLLVRDSNLLVVPGASSITSVTELVAAAKAKPGFLKFASGGNSAPAHLVGELFKREAGVDMIHIPYKGPVAGVTGLLAGEVDLMFAATAAVVAHIKSGKLRVLAASTPNRVAAIPDVPTLAELGYPKVAVANWFGIVAPAGTPNDVVSRLDLELQKVGAMPEIRQRLDAIGLESVSAGPEEFGAFMRSEFQKWNRLARDAGLKPD
jgi:tripartite-type tricarboxylate transporter receptor subunit TctC